MTPSEINKALATLTILVDTREQETSRLQVRLKEFKCNIERIKLDYGDYSAKIQLPSDEWEQLNVAIERKMSLDELAQCYTTGRKRFEREFVRAKDAGAKVYLLVENATWEDAYIGNYRSKMLPKAFIASLLAWLARYNCQLVFCRQRTTGKLIFDILYREARELLEGRMLDEE